MLRRVFLMALVPFSGVLPAAMAKGAPASAPLTPKMIVQNLYDAYRAASSDSYSNPLDSFPLETYMTPEFYRLYLIGTTANTVDEVPILDWDPFINGQDFEIRSVKVSAKSIDANHLVVTAIFDNGGVACEALYDFVMTENGWRIDNVRYPNSIDYPEGFDLKAHIEAHLKDIVPEEPVN